MSDGRESTRVMLIGARITIADHSDLSRAWIAAGGRCMQDMIKEHGVMIEPAGRWYEEEPESTAKRHIRFDLYLEIV